MIPAMSTALIVLLLALATAVVLVVRDILRDPVRCSPCSHIDAFAPRWDDRGVSSWSR